MLENCRRTGGGRQMLNNRQRQTGLIIDFDRKKIVESQSEILFTVVYMDFVSSKQ